MASKRLSERDFHTLISALLDGDGPKVEYRNPDAWRGYHLLK